MAIIFDNNNNSEMFFDKINNGSSFGVIEEVFFLVLAKMHCNPTAICYCENKQDKNMHRQTPVEIKEHIKNTTFDQNYNSLHYRQSSAQNIKINEIANDLESGKIVGKKIISNAEIFYL